MSEQMKYDPIKHEVKIYVAQLFGGPGFPLIVLHAECVHCGHSLAHENNSFPLLARHAVDCPVHLDEMPAWAKEQYAKYLLTIEG